MSVRNALWSCVVVSIFLAALALRPLPRYLPLLDQRVRSASIEAMDELRGRGYWLINMELMATEVTENQVCFTWEYRYRNRTIVFDPETIHTCHDA